MAEAKKTTEDNPTEDEGADTAVDNGANELAAGDEETPEQEVGGTTAAVSTAKKVLGAKEAAPFAWKVVGTSGDTALILFKTVERTDAEAQLTRLSSDGYYKDLRVVDINTKIVQPKPAKTRRSAAKPPEKTKKAKKVAGAKASKAKKKTPPAKKSASKAARAKGTRKSVVKGAKAKTASVKSGKKKAARKK